jgi:hypothetical protein
LRKEEQDNELSRLNPFNPVDKVLPQNQKNSYLHCTMKKPGIGTITADSAFKDTEILVP